MTNCDEAFRFRVALAGIEGALDAYRDCPTPDMAERVLALIRGKVDQVKEVRV
jgi:hypothetical protein